MFEFISDLAKFESRKSFSVIKELKSGTIVSPISDEDKNILENSVLLNDENIIYYSMKDKYFLLNIKHIDDGLVKFDFIDITDLRKKYLATLQVIEELQIDFTTKLPIKRKLFDDMIGYITSSKSHEFGVLICDIDNFKMVNDQYGHNIGDKVLRSVSMQLSKNIRSGNFRPKDIIGRYGGEEIVILVKNIKSIDLENVAERLRNSVQKMELDMPITISIGFVHSSETQDLLTSFDDYENVCAELIAMADKGLYYSKQSGKNKVTGYHQINGNFQKTKKM